MAWLHDWRSWWDALTRDQAFFFAIPFLVAAAALIADRLAHARRALDRAEAATPARRRHRPSRRARAR